MSLIELSRLSYVITVERMGKQKPRSRKQNWTIIFTEDTCHVYLRKHMVGSYALT